MAFHLKSIEFNVYCLVPALVNFGGDLCQDVGCQDAVPLLGEAALNVVNGRQPVVLDYRVQQLHLIRMLRKESNEPRRREVKS